MNPFHIRPRFSLRTLFVVVTALSITSGWVAYQLNWIHERHEALGWFEDETKQIGCPSIAGTAPWSLRLFGENGWKVIESPFDPTDSRIAKLRKLFPEAGISARNQLIKPTD